MFRGWFRAADLSPPRSWRVGDGEVPEPEALAKKNASPLWVAADGETYHASALEPHLEGSCLPFGVARSLFLGHPVYPSIGLEDYRPVSNGEGHVAIEMEPPEALSCAVSYDVMSDPVIASDGRVYAREVLERIYNQDPAHLSPYTKEPLDPIAFRHRQIAAETKRLYPALEVVSASSPPRVDLRDAAAKWPPPKLDRGPEALRRRARAAALGAAMGATLAWFAPRDPENPSSWATLELVGAGLGAVLGAHSERIIARAAREVARLRAPAERP